MTYYAQTLVWPLLTAVLAAALLFFLRHGLRKPLTERKHPLRFILAWLALIGVWLACTALIYGLAERVGLKSSLADTTISIAGISRMHPRIRKCADRV